MRFRKALVPTTWSCTARIRPSVSGNRFFGYLPCNGLEYHSSRSFSTVTPSSGVVADDKCNGVMFSSASHIVFLKGSSSRPWTLFRALAVCQDIYTILADLDGAAPPRRSRPYGAFSKVCAARPAGTSYRLFLWTAPKGASPQPPAALCLTSGNRSIQLTSPPGC
ncbi:uncharacterized protein LOC123318979 [Coccinella septempunctata]|uniref:uncharacterized protein LOC123318979 n=1 Tax=Coccinella septempunctata TaxID=41139 RepID=UPI001D073F49|nr:uncharacterized protein LOC123318979 [Coccinella septempunctata]